MFIYHSIFLLLISITLSHEGHNHKSHSMTSGLIRGLVIDELTEQPKKYANISIVKAGTEDIITGGITDEEGLFLIDKIPHPLSKNGLYQQFYNVRNQI